MEVEKQKEQVQNGSPKINIVKSCMTGDGIVQISNPKFYRQLFKDSDKQFSFFIPSSGSGSRMFQFIYDFLLDANSSDTSQIEQFINRLEDFAFFKVLPNEIQEQVRKHDFDVAEIVDFIVQNEGLDFGNKPKALIPFHQFGPFILNPVQEHVLQGNHLGGTKNKFHFTISGKYEKDYNESITALNQLVGNEVDVTLSTQNESSHSLVFDEKLKPILDNNGAFFKRPSGHGALIENLDKIESDFIFIKNIDNVQHYSNSKISKDGISMLFGISIDIKERISSLLNLEGKLFKDSLRLLNLEFQLFEESSIDLFSEAKLKSLMDRPLRVCGMVKNEGQPGGGPFWVSNTSGELSKQIVEKSQIDLKSNQFKILSQSTHFNPVFMAISVKNHKGDKFKLSEYINNDEYFVVNKSQEGKLVKFIEKPGLWNGGMSNWNTVFVEMDPAVFTPVKTVLDLLKPLHFSS